MVALARLHVPRARIGLNRTWRWTHGIEPIATHGLLNASAPRPVNINEFLLNEAMAQLQLSLFGFPRCPA